MKLSWPGAALVLAGIALIVAALWPGSSPWRVKTEPIPVPPDYRGHHAIESLTRQQIRQRDGSHRLTVHVARYLGDDGQPRQAIVPPPGSNAWRHWQSLGKVLQQLEPDALILAWWDDGQRADLFGGRAVWVRKPPPTAFAPLERSLWRQLSVGFGDREGKLTRLARWLTQAPQPALQALAALEPQRPRYLLVSTDLLLHLEEIERLAGNRVPLAVRLFPETTRLHDQIAAVRAWAGDTPYLPLKVPVGVAAWGLIDGQRSLLTRLLPFTGQPPEPPPDLTEVFRSPDRQLALYRLQ